MGRTYRRNGDDYSSYGKSLREKRQRGSVRNKDDSYESQSKKRRNKNWDANSTQYDDRNYGLS